MTRYFVSGATGTIGKKVLHYLQSWRKEVYWGTRNPNSHENGQRYFDIKDQRRCSEALRSIDVLFLIRPPQLSDQAIIPLIDNAVLQGVQHIVFMSVQGAEQMPFTPHAKIEKHIQKRGIAYTFLRPGYFMENLTGPLKKDIQQGRIYLPAGRARFAWTHGEDIALAAAQVMANHYEHKGQAYTLTGPEALNFEEVCAAMQKYGIKVVYKDSDGLSFYRHRKAQGDAPIFIAIMGTIHYLQRFQKLNLNHTLAELIQKERPISTLKDFLKAHKETLLH